MKTLKLHDGTRMPALGLGTWLSKPDEVYRAVRFAIEVGYRHVDGAWIYLNEEGVGRAIRDAIAAGDVRREDLWVTTKLWNDHHAPQHVRPALTRSLGLLGLDYVDLYLVHWPVAHRHGIVRPQGGSEFVSLETLPLAATWEAMAKLPATGLTRHVGVSNFSASKVAGLIASVGVTPAVDQVEMHPLLAQNELLAAMREHGVVVTAYAPLGSGGRPDGLRRDDEERLLDHPMVAAVAAARGCTPAQALIAWGLGRGVAVIPKSIRPDHIRSNFAAAEIALRPEEIQALDALDRGERYVTGSLWCPPGSPYTIEQIWE